MKLFIEKSRFRVGAGERKRLWWRTEQTICLYYQKIIQIRIEKCAFDRLRHQFSVPSTGSGTGSSNKYNTVIELVEITGMMSENVPSTSSGINFRCLRQAQAPGVVINITRWLGGAEITENMSENVPSTSSGTESNTVAERSRSHHNDKSFLQILENLPFLS